MGASVSTVSASASATSVTANKLQPIREEGLGGSDAGVTSNAASGIISKRKTEPLAEKENKPKSPYMRRKRRSVQPEFVEMKLYQDTIQSDSPSPAESPSKRAEAAI